MRPAVKRRLVTLAAVASLVLCIATVTLWVRSYWREDIVTLERASSIAKQRKQWRLWSLRGGIRFEYERDGAWFIVERPSLRYGAVPREFSGYPYRSASPPAQKFRLLGFQLFVENWTDSWGPAHATSFVAPWLAFVLAFGTAPLLVAVRRYRSHARQGRCRTCGYDLRATPERCPECGAVPTAT
jgi:hypothetical protein